MTLQVRASMQSGIALCWDLIERSMCVVGDQEIPADASFVSEKRQSQEESR
jgi:hypothetical protein